MRDVVNSIKDNAPSNLSNESDGPILSIVPPSEEDIQGQKKPTVETKPYHFNKLWSSKSVDNSESTDDDSTLFLSKSI